MAGRCEVGVLTVARYLREGIGSDVRCFVNTKSGLREVEGFRGQPGFIQAILMGQSRQRLIQFPVPVLLDTEVFLARRDLTGMRYKDVLLIAEQAASTNALTLAQVPLDVVITALEIPCTTVNESEVTVDDAPISSTSHWQG